MNAVVINAKDFIDDTMSVVDCAMRIAAEATRHLRSGGRVVVSIKGVRGVSSSFFNVILSAVADTLHNDLSEQRFDVECDTPTQRLVYTRSLAAFQTLPKAS
jgi:hypothetical protein